MAVVIILMHVEMALQPMSFQLRVEVKTSGSNAGRMSLAVKVVVDM